MGQIRLYIPQLLSEGTSVILDDGQSHYLTNVMKVKPGQKINCFDNQSGEYVCEVAEIGKKRCELRVLNFEKPFKRTPDIWLLFAPVKKDNTDFIIQKATELGAAKIIPVITRYTISERVKTERYVMQAIEASEQCRRTDIPEIGKAIKFEDIFKNWEQGRTLYYMDETLNGEAVGQVFASAPEPCAVLVGPEGGFSEDELKRLRQTPFAKGVRLGQRILRAETAVAAALSCWQALSGDWK